MNKTRIATLLAVGALSLAAAACTETTTNSNANGNTVNSNTAVVTNNNGNSNTAGVTATNSNMANANTNMTARGSRNYNMTRDEYDKDDVNYRKEAKEAGDSIGTTATDGWIHLKTRGALATVDDLRDSTINVDVDNAVVTLKGTVASQAHVTAADKAAKGVEGVKSVKNMLKVGAAGSNANANTNTKKG